MELWLGRLLDAHRSGSSCISSVTQESDHSYFQHPFISECDLAHTSIVHSKVLHARMPEQTVGLEESALQLVAKVRLNNYPLHFFLRNLSLSAMSVPTAQPGIAP